MTCKILNNANLFVCVCIWLRRPSSNKIQWRCRVRLLCGGLELSSLLFIAIQKRCRVNYTVIVIFHLRGAYLHYRFSRFPCICYSQHAIAANDIYVQCAGLLFGWLCERLRTPQLIYIRCSGITRHSRYISLFRYLFPHSDICFLSLQRSQSKHCNWNFHSWKQKQCRQTRLVLHRWSWIMTEYVHLFAYIMLHTCCERLVLKHNTHTQNPCIINDLQLQQSVHIFILNFNLTDNIKWFDIMASFCFQLFLSPVFG